MGVEETREAVKIQVESAIHQRGLIVVSQFMFLFCAIKQIIHLIGKRISWVLLKKFLKWSLLVLFIGNGKIAFFTQGARESGLANSAWTDNDDEFIHGFDYKRLSFIPLT